MLAVGGWLTADGRVARPGSFSAAAGRIPRLIDCHIAMVQASAAEKPKAARDKMHSGLWPYVIVNSSYLIYTVTDGAVRMIVLLHAFNLGFTAMEIATMYVWPNCCVGTLGVK